MKQVFRELKKPEVKNRFSSIIVDTIDIAAERCKKYICNQNDIEDLGDLGYGKGWSKFKDEFNEVFRGLTQLGYAVFFIGHHKETVVTSDSNTEKIIIRPALSSTIREIIAGMADIYGYAHQPGTDKMSVLTLRDSSGVIECGCRFKYIKNEIPLNYQNLVQALQEAIDLEAEETSGKYVTSEKQVYTEAKKLNYQDLMSECNTIIYNLLEKDDKIYPARITQIIERYLGKGKKLSETNENQAEFIQLILEDLRDLSSEV